MLEGAWQICLNKRVVVRTVTTKLEKTKKIFAPLLFSLAISSPVYALDLVPWGEAGSWTILTDPNHKDGCAAEAAYDDGTYFRMGFTHKGKKAYLATFSPAWEKYEHDRKFPVTIKMDDDTFEGEAHRIKLNDVPGARVKFDNPDFLVDIAKKNKMTISAEGAEVISIGLDGSMKAMEAAIVCQAEQ